MRYSEQLATRLNAVKCSATEAKSKELDTNAFLLNLTKFSRIWEEWGLIFLRENLTLTLLEMRGTHIFKLIEIGLKL